MTPERRVEIEQMAVDSKSWGGYQGSDYRRVLRELLAAVKAGDKREYAAFIAGAEAVGDIMFDKVADIDEAFAAWKAGQE